MLQRTSFTYTDPISAEILPIKKYTAKYSQSQYYDESLKITVMSPVSEDKNKHKLFTGMLYKSMKKKARRTQKSQQ